MNNSIFIQIKIIYDKWVCEKITEALQVNHKRIHCCKKMFKKTKQKLNLWMQLRHSRMIGVLTVQ
jgi:hypothetical protein